MRHRAPPNAVLCDSFGVWIDEAKLLEVDDIVYCVSLRLLIIKLVKWSESNEPEGLKQFSPGQCPG